MEEGAGGGRLTIGEITGPYGVAGDCWVRADGERDGREPLLARGPALEGLRLEKDGETKDVRLTAARRVEAGAWIVTVEGVTSRDLADTLRGCRLTVAAAEAPALGEGEFYVHELVGREVRAEDGRSLGILKGVMRTGANDVYEIDAPEGELLFPALKDLVLDIPRGGRTMTVRVPPGLLEACLHKRKA